MTSSDICYYIIFNYFENLLLVSERWKSLQLFLIWIFISCEITSHFVADAISSPTLICFLWTNSLTKTADVSIVRLNDVKVLIFKVSVQHNLNDGRIFLWRHLGFLALQLEIKCNVFDVFNLRIWMFEYTLLYKCLKVYKHTVFLQRIRFGLGGRALRLKKDKLGPSEAAIGKARRPNENSMLSFVL